MRDASSIVLNLVAIGALALALLALAPAAHSAPLICKPVVSAFGKPKPLNKPGWGIQAKKSAIAAWENKVKGKYGAAFANWSLAKNKDYDCVKGISSYHCLAKAAPCKSAVAGNGAFVSPQAAKCKPKLGKWGKWYHKKAKAKKSAKVNWQLKAAAKYGAAWSHWGKAKNKSLDQCVQGGNGAYRCYAIARPCK